MSTENIAHEKRYRDWLAQYDAISASNGSYVNALDISKEYGDGRNPLVLKSEFIMSLCEQLMGAGEIGAKEKSIIDRCTANIYRKYIRR